MTDLPGPVAGTGVTALPTLEGFLLSSFRGIRSEGRTKGPPAELRLTGILGVTTVNSSCDGRTIVSHCELGKVRARNFVRLRNA